MLADNFGKEKSHRRVSDPCRWDDQLLRRNTCMQSATPIPDFPKPHGSRASSRRFGAGQNDKTLILGEIRASRAFRDYANAFRKITGLTVRLRTLDEWRPDKRAGQFCPPTPRSAQKRMAG